MILGSVFIPEYVSKYKKDNVKSKHFEVRRDRMALVLENSKPLYFFEVIKDSERQVHVLYEDASLYVFNKETGLVITVILPSRKTMAKYFAAANDYASEHRFTQRCAKIHEKFVKNSHELSHEEVQELRKIKIKHLKMKG